MNQGSRFQVVIVDVAESHHLLVLDVAVFGVTTPHSSGADDGDPQVLTSTKRAWQRIASPWIGV